ncbi:peptidoglycan-binding domain-containing protein [Streptomyces sp. NPDC007346]|uniref:peptidoglycan-binding domain-containing protein n=1 Tax=Streptomyces sp. NPDC007346 TaxID=3154682 RepID=UPI003452A933
MQTPTAPPRSLRRTLRTVAAATAAATVMLALPLIGASPAAAALPSCTTTDRGIVPAAGPKNHQCVLGVGNQGTAVRALQKSLRTCNGQNITVDGAYGPNTRQAVINIQRKAGIAQDGVYGPKTAQAMRWNTGQYCYNYLSLL